MRASIATPLFLVACLAGGACKRTPPAMPATPAASAVPAPATAPIAATPAPATAVPANDNLNAVAWMQRAAEYRANTETVYQAATARLDTALKQQWDALVPEERPARPGPRPPAVVMDVDETVLDNSPYQVRLVQDDKEFDDLSWDQWVAEKKARAVPGAVAFAKAAAARGITVLYISTRAEHLQAATIANLRALGFPVKDDGVFLGLGTFVKDCEQNGSEKLCRRKLAGQQYRVLMQFGDQLGDFVQILANTPDARGKLVDAQQAWWGERWWMLPNPSYGSWEPALFNNDWAQPRDARRAAKRATLDATK